MTLVEVSAKTLQLPLYGSPADMSSPYVLSFTDGRADVSTYRNTLQALAAGDGHQAVKSNLHGQAGLSQGDVFTEHEIKIFAQRQIIAYNGDFSSRLEA